MRESGFDTSFRFGPFSGSTEPLRSRLPQQSSLQIRDATWLTSPLCWAATQRPLSGTTAPQFGATPVNKYLWNPTTDMFYDYDFTTNQQSTYNYLTAFYPLWAGLASPEQASALEHHLSLFEHDGGLAMSDDASGTQWDLPFGWAPTNWLATKGLDEYGFTSDASRIATKFTQTVRQNF